MIDDDEQGGTMNRLRTLAALALGAIVLPLAAQPVNRAEIESVKGRKIEFINYVGPHDVVDTKDQIYAIGEDMGLPVARGARTAGSLDRYAVIHAVDPSVKTGFDADIVVLGKDAGVDHIRNLRWIVSGFLEKGYGYSRKDADVLAEFVTIYNAVYRGDLDYYGSRYKAVVMGHLSKENAGLALRWDEWRGRTRIVIPLGANAASGKLSSVDTRALTEEKVVSKMREADDKSVDARKGMVDIKEREIKESDKAIAAGKDDLAAKDKALADEKAAIAAEEKSLAEEKAGIVDRAEDKDAIAAREAALEERKAAAAAAEKERADLDEAIKREEAAKAAKTEEVKEDRATIAKDQQTAIKEELTGKPGEDAKGEPAGTFPQALSMASPHSRLVSLNLSTGGTLKQSEVNTIRARTLLESGDLYYCVAGGMVAQQAVRLISIEKASLKLKGEGKDDLFEDSLLIQNGGKFYAVVAKGGAFYVGTFDDSLKLTAVSDETVHPYTVLSFMPEGLFVQLGKGGFAFLDPASLKAKKILRN
jgi:hypothetical protein